MIRLLRNPERVSMVLASIFFLAILVSAYTLYSLPGNLMLTHGYEAVLTKTYATIATTFALGALAIFVAIKTRTELIVFKEKLQETIHENEASAEGQKTTISLEGIKSSLSQSKEPTGLYQDFLHSLCRQLDAGQGAFYESAESEGVRKVSLRSGYALSVGENAAIEFDFGEGLVGQAAAGGRTLYIDDVPEGYIKIISGLGSASPRYLLIVPVKDQNKVLGVIEIASFTHLTEDQRKFVEEAALLLTEKLAMLK